MDDLKSTIAKNLILYRRKANLTQSELAEKINYSDKAISKWERAESTPDIFTLKAIADIYGIKVDELLVEHTTKEEITLPELKFMSKKHLIITLISSTVVWFLATLIFVVLRFVLKGTYKDWMVFIYAIPAYFTVLLIFNAIWGKLFLNYFFISGIIWSGIVSVFLSLHNVPNIWLMFIIAVPLQVMVILWYFLRLLYFKKKHNKVK